MMKCNKKREYNFYKGILHSFNPNNNTISHTIIYYRHEYTEEGDLRAREILTGRTFPNAVAFFFDKELRKGHQFISGESEAYDYEVTNYLVKILSSQRIFHEEISEILSSEGAKLPTEETPKIVKTRK